MLIYEKGVFQKNPAPFHAKLRVGTNRRLLIISGSWQLVNKI